MKFAYKLFLASAVLLGVSCTNKIETDVNQPEQTEVNLSLQGDYIQPAYKAGESTDIIAIQVHQRANENGSKYKPYCYGLWDTTADINLTLNKGFLYRFETTIIPNAKNIIAASNIDGSMRQPFSVAGTKADSRVGNRFIYSTSNYFTYLTQGMSAIKDDKLYTIFNRPLLNRYHGSSVDVLAGDKNQIELTTKHVVFALKYEVTGFKDGTIRVSIKDSQPIILTPTTVATARTTICFHGSASETGIGWSDDQYSEIIPYTVHWVKNDNTEVLIMQSESNFQRKMLYNMVIDLTQNENSGSIDIGKEDDGFGDGGNIN